MTDCRTISIKNQQKKAKKSEKNKKRAFKVNYGRICVYDKELHKKKRST